MAVEATPRLRLRPRPVTARIMGTMTRAGIKKKDVRKGVRTLHRVPAVAALLALLLAAVQVTLIILDVDIIRIIRERRSQIPRQ